MMSYAQIMATIRSIEANFPVDRLVYKDLHIWPWLRIRIANDLFWNVTVHSSENQGIYQEALAKSGIGSGEHSLQASNAIGQFRRKMKAAVCGHLKSVGSPRVLFYTVGFEYTQIEDKYFNRFFDPVKSLLTDMNISHAEVCTGFDRPTYEPSFSPALSISQIHSIPPMIADLSIEHGLVGSIDCFGEFLQFCSENRLHVPLNYNTLIERLEHLVEYSGFYTAILEAAQPSLGFLVCYYHDCAMAFVHACRKCGVQTVEMQHSIICHNDWNWNQWDCAPAACMDLLPDYFWAWSESYADMLQPAGAPQHEFLHPLVGGNLWVSAWKDRFAATPKKDLPIQNPNKRTILYAAPVGNREMLPELFPDAVLDAIRNSPPDWRWLFRIHYKTDDQLYSQMVHYIKERVGEIEIHRSSEIQLYELFEQVDYQIAQTSTNIIEAEVFDIPNIVVGQEAAQWFQNDIDNGYYHFARHAQEIIEYIRNDRRPAARKADVIYTDNSAALKTLYDLLFSDMTGDGSLKNYTRPVIAEMDNNRITGVA